MADVLKRLAGPVALTTSAATYYTVPAATTTALRDVCVCNETGTSAAFTLSIGTDGAGKRVYKGAAVPGNATFQRTGNIPLAAGEIVQAFADTASALTITLSGVESA